MTELEEHQRATLARLRALADLRRWADLEASAREALASMPQRADVHAHLARSLLLQDRADEAIAAAGAGLRIAPGHEWLRRVLTSALVAAGRTDDAAEHIDRLLAEDPGDYHVRILAARVALRRMQVEDAQQHARAALEADSGRAGGYVMLAAALSQAGFPLQAEEVSRTGLTVDPNSGDIHCQLAVTLERTGRRAEAAMHWIEAGRVGRYPEVAVDGLRQLMVEPPLRWLWGLIGTVATVLSLAGSGLLIDDRWTAAVVGVAIAAVTTLVATPLLTPLVRRRRRRRTFARLPPAAKSVIELAGGDERL